MQVVVEVGTRFAALAGAGDVIGRRFIEQLVARTSATCRRLGIADAGLPGIQPAAGDEVIRVRLSGRVHRCPEVVSRAVSDYYLRDEPGPPIGGSDWSEEMAACLRGGDLARALATVEALAAIAGHIIESAADQLIDREQARQVADADEMGLSRRWADLATVLKTPASLGVVISDRRRVMKIIAEAVDRRLSAADVAEIVTARLRSRRIRIEAHPQYFEDIADFFLEGTIAVDHPDAPAALREQFDEMAEDLFNELGVRIPEIQLAANEDLTGYQVRIIVGDAAPSLRIGLAPNHLLVAEPVEALSKHGIAATPAAHPFNGSECSTIGVGDRDARGSLTRDPVGYLVLVTAAELRRHAATLVDLDSVERELAALHEAFPALVLTVLERITVGHLARVMRLLLRDQIGIRNLRVILESLLAAGLLNAARPPDPVADAEHGAAVVRAAMSGYLAHKHRWSTVYVLGPELQHELETLIAGERGGSNVSESELEARRQRIRAAVCAALGAPRGPPPVILTRAVLRLRLSRLMADQRPDLLVLRHEELPLNPSIAPPTTISLTNAGPIVAGTGPTELLPSSAERITNSCAPRSIHSVEIKDVPWN
jgi:hypothetical protein